MKRLLWTRGGTALALGVLSAAMLIVLGSRTAVAAQDSTPSAAPDAYSGPITYPVQAGDTLFKLATRHGLTVADLVDVNHIENPDLILVGQVLTIAAKDTSTPTISLAPSGPLALAWSVLDWHPADPDYTATVRIVPQGGIPPYTFYHDGLVQPGDTFEIAWRRCRSKPGSVGLGDAGGAVVTEDYWLPAPYCPLGIEILDPAEGAELTHYPRHFNLTWAHTVDPPPSAYGIEIEVWERGQWRAWRQYEHKRGDKALFFVPDAFPGDLGGRVRMWGIYEGFAGPKTPWRYFEFRVTY